MTNVLIVDDDANIRKLIKATLHGEGYGAVEAANGEEALRLMDATPVDLIVLDIMMPGMDGWEFCRTVKETKDIPIIMVTAKGEVSQKIKGFRLGTDDYLVKPFDPMELLMRVKALLKRYRIEHSQTVQLGDVSIDRRMHEVQVKDRRHLLPLKDFELLFRLARSPGQIFTRGQLIEQIWGSDYDGDERTVDVHVRRLRERLDGESDHVSIVTVRGLGYRLEVKP